MERRRARAPNQVGLRTRVLALRAVRTVRRVLAETDRSCSVSFSAVEFQILVRHATLDVKTMSDALLPSPRTIIGLQPLENGRLRLSRGTRGW
jgi:hypothetical protein